MNSPKHPGFDFPPFIWTDTPLRAPPQAPTPDAPPMVPADVADLIRKEQAERSGIAQKEEF